MDAIKSTLSPVTGQIRDVVGPVIPHWVTEFTRGRSNTFWAGSAVIPAAYIIYKFVRSPGRVRVPHPNKTVGPEDPEIVIIGSGIFGSTLAAVLGKDGRRVVVIERDLSEPDRFVGEFLQPGGVKALKILDIEETLEGLDSPPFKGYVMHDVMSSKTQTQMLFPPETVSGQGFHHGRFIQSLRKCARAQKTVTYIEAIASEVIYEDGVAVGVSYHYKGDEEMKEIRAPLTIVCDGIYSNFRRNLVNNKAQAQGHFCGVLLQHCPQTIDKHLEVVLAEPSFSLHYQISPTETRALVDVPTCYTAMPKDMQAYLREQVLPSLPTTMKPSFKDAVDNQRYGTLGLGFLPANPKEIAGLMLLGDALNLRHALTGSGMTSCFNDIIMIRDIMRRNQDLYNYSRVMTAYRAFIAFRKKHSFSINVFSFTLYHIFSSPDPHMIKLKQGFYQYFRSFRVGKRAGINLISVLKPSAKDLLVHMYLAMLYGCYCEIKSDLLLPRSLYNCACMLVKGTKMALPFILGEM